MKCVTPESVGAKASGSVSERSYLAIQKSGCSLAEHDHLEVGRLFDQFTKLLISRTVVEFSKLMGGLEKATRQYPEAGVDTVNWLSVDAGVSLSPRLCWLQSAQSDPWLLGRAPHWCGRGPRVPSRHRSPRSAGPRFDL